jgi:flavin reductase (DIM6/NTAB) family NADH-FMN oxidoreductase RutF
MTSDTRQGRTPERRIIDPDASSGVYPVLGALVAPRPIGWVSTTSPEGVDNLAPHSFFQIVSTAPPIVMISSMGEKDTVRNARATGEFVVCGAPAALVDRINVTGIDFPAGISEFDEAGIDREPSAKVRPPRVAQSPFALECVVHDIQEICNAVLLLGRVVLIAVDETLFDDSRVRTSRADLIARLGGSEWSELGPIHDLPRIALEDYQRDEPRE